MGAPRMSTNRKMCVTCAHHERDHSHPLGCQRCSESHQHRFLSPTQAMGLIDEHPDLQFSGSEIPPHIELQARLYALDMAVKSYDLVTEAQDEPLGADWIDQAAERYLAFLMSRSYSS